MPLIFIDANRKVVAAGDPAAVQQFSEEEARSMGFLKEEKAAVPATPKEPEAPVKVAEAAPAPEPQAKAVKAPPENKAVRSPSAVKGRRD